MLAHGAAAREQEAGGEGAAREKGAGQVLVEKPRYVPTGLVPKTPREGFEGASDREHGRATREEGAGHPHPRRRVRQTHAGRESTNNPTAPTPTLRSLTAPEQEAEGKGAAQEKGAGQVEETEVRKRPHTHAQPSA